MMKPYFFFVAVLIICMSVGWGSEVSLQENDGAVDISLSKTPVKRIVTAGDDDDDDDDLNRSLSNPPKKRLFTTGALNFGTGTTSVTIGNAGYLTLGAYLLVPLIIGLALLFYLYGGPGGSSSSSGYTSTGYTNGREINLENPFSRSDPSFDPYGINWNQFTILDFISIAEDAYRNFDPADLECQKRLICEVHQNTSKFGVAAEKMVDLFSYLQYVEVLSLPEEFKALVEEYLDAADRGRTLQKDCGDVFSTCDFSVKSLADKYTHNEI